MSRQKKSTIFRFSKLAIISFLLILTVLLASCNVANLGKRQDRDGVTTTQAHTGTKGLVMEFVQGTPPARIYETNTLTFLVELRNKGAWQLGAGSGRLYLTGFDQDIVSIPIARGGVALPLLEPKTQFNPDGGYDTITFESMKVSMPKGLDSYKPRFVLTACYDYVTEASLIVCVDPDPYSPSSEKSCTPSTVSGAAGQGAPIAISSVAVESMPGKVQFKIDITNSGGGQVVDVVQCPFNLEYQNINQISVDQVRLGTRAGTCRPSGKLRLVNNRATIYCDFDISDRTTTYTTPLNIRITYGYMDSITKDVEIRSIS